MECLNSIYMTSVDEGSFEVICVNDCSPDCSREVILEYQTRHKNLLLIDHTENKKAGGARNTGLLAAKGEYVWFVDADDTIAPSALKTILEVCETNDLDALCFNYALWYHDRKIEEKVGQNKIKVVVLKWCSSSYLEDQDKLRMFWHSRWQAQSLQYRYFRERFCRVFHIFFPYYNPKN